MSFSIVYLLHQFFWRIWAFIRDWYVGGFRRVAHATISTLERLDHIFALVITLRHFGEPLYGDRTIIGYILGFMFRTFRALIATILYLLVVAAGIAAYLFWALIPFLIIGWGFAETV